MGTKLFTQIISNEFCVNKNNISYAVLCVDGACHVFALYRVLVNANRTNRQGKHKGIIH